MEKILFGIAMAMLSISSFMELLFGIEEAGEESPAVLFFTCPLSLIIPTFPKCIRTPRTTPSSTRLE